MKTALLLIASLFTLQAYALDDKTFDCTLAADSAIKLSFTMSSERNVIIFNDLATVPGLLVEGEYLGMTEDQFRKVSFEYDYYFTGRGEIEFDRQTWQYRPGDRGQIVFNYDDGDGSGIEGTFNCTIR